MKKTWKRYHTKRSIKVLEDLNPTTRCYTRTLAEAFPHDPENYQWFFPPERRISRESIIMGMIALILWVVIAYLLTAP